MLAALEAELWQIDVGEQILPGAKQNRRHRKMHLVDMADAKILSDRCDAAAETDVAALGGLLSACQGGLDAIGDEVESRAALHGDRRSRVMREDEDGHVIGR